MSFKDYIKEQEELAIVKVEEDKRQKLVDFIKTIDELNDEKFHNFAVDELGMDPDEAETVVYKMLKAFLLTGDEDGDGIPDDMGVVGDDELPMEEPVEGDIEEEL